jgi:hypothetical protein
MRNTWFSPLDPQDELALKRMVVKYGARQMVAAIARNHNLPQDVNSREDIDQSFRRGLLFAVDVLKPGLSKTDGEHAEWWAENFDGGQSRPALRPSPACQGFGELRERIHLACIAYGKQTVTQNEMNHLEDHLRVLSAAQPRH